MANTTTFTNADDRKLEKFQIRWEPELSAAIDDEARRLRRPKAQLVRDVLWSFIEETRRRKP